MAVVMHTMSVPFELWLAGTVLLALGYLIALAPSKRFALAVGVALAVAGWLIFIPCGYVLWPYC